MGWEEAQTRAGTNLLARFGTPAVITQPGEPDRSDNVIFDLYSMGEMGVLTDKPQITVRDSFIDGVDLKSAAITVTGKYPEARMSKPLPDGGGFTILLLTRI